MYRAGRVSRLRPGKPRHLPVAAQADLLVLLPRRALRRPRLRREVRAALVQATAVAPGRRDTAELAVLHRRAADPVDARVVPDRLVALVDHDDLVPAVTRVLANPVRVQHAEARDLAPDALLGHGAEVPRALHLVHTRVARLTVHDALGDHLLAAAAADTAAEDGVALLGLVAEHARLLRAGRARAAADGRELAVLPGAQAQQEAHDIRLLLLPELVKVLVGAHVP